MPKVPLLLAAATAFAWAHPAVHVVMDSQGAVYYSDTARVWRIGPGGERTVAVPNVHTHQLWIDADGNLFGEHLAFAGGNQWTHRVWKRAPDGRISDVIATRRGLLSEYRDFSLIRDGSGAMYWCKDDGTIEVQRGPNQPVQVLAKLGSREFGWVSALPNGGLLVADHGMLIHVAGDGRLRTIPLGTNKRDRHAVMAAWSDRQGNVYAADWDAAAVKKITPTGTVSVVVSAADGWRPTGGLTAPDGTIWVLEASPANEQRVRRVAR